MRQAARGVGAMVRAVWLVGASVAVLAALVAAWALVTRAGLLP